MADIFFEMSQKQGRTMYPSCLKPQGSFTLKCCHFRTVYFQHKLLKFVVSGQICTKDYVKLPLVLSSGQYVILVIICYGDI